jgi:uncharacterized protein YodC (DUF2158 family)
MSLNQRKLYASDLDKVRSAETFQDEREPAFWLGNFVELNSGGPIMMIVEQEGDAVVAAWQDKAGRTHERSFPAVCVHRVSIASASI